MNAAASRTRRPDGRRGRRRLPLSAFRTAPAGAVRALRAGLPLLLAAPLLLAPPARAQAVAAPAATASDAWLVVERVRDGLGLLALPLRPGPDGADPAWSVVWNHSVTGIRVEDLYAWRDGRMVLTGSVQPAFDAGLGHVPGRGRVETHGEHGYRIVGIDEPVPGNAYRLRIGPARVDHRIALGGIVVSLSALAAGEAATVRVVERRASR